jgi:hypothetical protein
MASRERRTPTSYDEIERRTVATPDLSYRPTHDEEQASRHRAGLPTEHPPHALSARERGVLDRVRHALAADPVLDLGDVVVEIDQDEIVLRGSVPGPATAIRIEEVAAAVSGVARIDNQLTVRGRRA